MRASSTSSFLGAAACVVALLACAPDPGPIHRCAVIRSERRTADGRDAGYSTAVRLIAAPGSLPPSTRGEVRYHGGAFPISTREDGSLVVGMSAHDHDLADDDIEVEVGSRTYRVRLDGRSEIALVATGDDPRFPSGETFIEDPIDTVAIRGRFAPVVAAPSPIEQTVAVNESRGAIEWLGPVEVGATIDHQLPGREHDSVLVAALHASGMASGCYATCRCSADRIAAGTCRPPEGPLVSALDVDVSMRRPPGDPSDAGVLDATLTVF